MYVCRFTDSLAIQLYTIHNSKQTKAGPRSSGTPVLLLACICFMVTLVTKDLHHASCAYEVQTNFRNDSIPGILYICFGWFCHCNPECFARLVFTNSSIFHYVQNDTNILFDLGQMWAILHFTSNAMSKVISNPTTRSGIPENPAVDTKIVSLLLFCQKYTNLLFDLVQIAVI